MVHGKKRKKSTEKRKEKKGKRKGIVIKPSKGNNTYIVYMTYIIGVRVRIGNKAKDRSGLSNFWVWVGGRDCARGTHPMRATLHVVWRCSGD